MTHRHDDADPIEHDPTGMRALLAGLPDPGPMPEDLVARITAALEEEARREASDPGAASSPVGYDDTGGGVLVPLHRRRAWQVLGAAAAAVVVLGVGGLVVEQVSPGGLQASLGLGQGGAADSAAMSGAGAEAGPPTREGAGLLARDDTLHVVVLATGTEYTGSSLATLAATLDEGAGVAPGDATAARPAGSDAVSDPLGARDCAAAVGIAPSEPVVVDLASFDGHSAAVLVATSSDGARRAWAVARDCRAGDPGVLDGPVPVG